MRERKLQSRRFIQRLSLSNKFIIIRNNQHFAIYMPSKEDVEDSASSFVLFAAVLYLV